MQPQIRPAAPGDLAAALPLLLSSGPTAFAYVFATDGCSATDFLREAYQDGKTPLGWRHLWLAEQHGKVLGSVGCWGAESNLPHTAHYLRLFLAHYGPLRATGVIWRGLRTETVIRPPVKGRLYLAYLGVAEQARSQGIGARLIEHVARLARIQGRSHVALDVAADNPRAHQLYLRLGFQEVALRPSRLRNARGHVPGMHYLELSLAESRLGAG